MRRLALFALAVLALVGCATGPSPGPATPAPSTPSNAVQSLLDQAQRARAGGDLEAASAHVERALRIDRRSPALYVELALIRYAEGAFGQAESLALKAVSLAPGEASLQSHAWAVVAQAREAAGDGAGAADARQRAGPVGTP